MPLITLHQGRLEVGGSVAVLDPGRVFRTGLAALDELAPGGGFVRGGVHELLYSPKEAPPATVAMLLARAATTRPDAPPAPLVWCDVDDPPYPPAMASAGIDLSRLYLLRPDAAAVAWTVAQCLRCRGIGAVVARVDRLGRVEARKLQLACEEGAGTGILLRPDNRFAAEHAATTRWRVEPAPIEAGPAHETPPAQRWKLTLAHGHGGCTGRVIFLEVFRDPMFRFSAKPADRAVRGPGQLVHRRASPASSRRSA